jgi:hypothetical protein
LSLIPVAFLAVDFLSLGRLERNFRVSVASVTLHRIEFASKTVPFRSGLSNVRQ